LYLIASGWFATLSYWGQGILGLGFLIFVHELGHFLVAKACGVKCEKFYLGFDIGGWKLWSMKRGETEYGIGILPLGGYVKMLGQDDNPANAEEEKQRSTVSNATSDAEQLDPRSYLAQSVPERMAIISAGVIMNLIFAMLLAAWAFHLGVISEECTIGATTPGEPAWRADIHPGDQVVSINDSKSTLPLSYTDLRASVAVSPSGEPITFHMRRDGEGGLTSIATYPDDRALHDRKNPTIGVAQMSSLFLMPGLPVDEGSPAEATGKFVTPCNDFELADVSQYRVVSVNGQPIKNHAEYVHAEIVNQDKPLRVTLEKGRSPKFQGELAGAEAFEIELAPTPMRHLGLTMTLGPIAALQDNSPAKEAGFKVGDQLVSIADKPVTDPLALPDLLRAMAGQSVDIVVKRTQGANAEDVTLKVALREGAWGENVNESVPLSIPSLGIACKIIPEVVAVDANGPAAAEGIHVGDKIKSAEILFGSLKLCKEKQAESKQPDKIAIDLMTDKGSWPGLMAYLQKSPPGTKVRLTLADDKHITLMPVVATDHFLADRGLNFQPLIHEVQATTLSQALEWGLLETKKQSSQVYSMVRSLITGRVSSTGLGGLGTIFGQASAHASLGFSMLLMFLTALSANLAVINMLPIPVLDGGHMVFLIYEAIFRKKPNENVQGALTWMGLAFVLFLVVFTNGMDVVRLFGGLGGK
jgi:regulator of sigma E protease